MTPILVTIGPFIVHRGELAVIIGVLVPPPDDAWLTVTEPNSKLGVVELTTLLAASGLAERRQKLDKRKK